MRRGGGGGGCRPSPPRAPHISRGGQRAWGAAGGVAAGRPHPAGGLAGALPHEPDRVTDYLERIDALVVTGGAFDVDPSYYGGGAKHATVITKDRRTAFEVRVTKGALGQKK